jgi:hypothetical protein
VTGQEWAKADGPVLTTCRGTCSATRPVSSWLCSSFCNPGRIHLAAADTTGPRGVSRSKEEDGTQVPVLVRHNTVRLRYGASGPRSPHAHGSLSHCLLPFCTVTAASVPLRHSTTQPCVSTGPVILSRLYRVDQENEWGTMLRTTNVVARSVGAMSQRH